MAEIKLNLNLKIPLYIQIKNILKMKIHNNQIPIGTRLSQRQIAKQLNVSRMPVAEAFQILESEGYIINKPQSGSIVLNNVWASIGEKQSSWQLYTDFSNYKTMPDGLINIFKKLDDSASHKLNGDRIAVSFMPEKLLISGMQSTIDRLQQQPEDLGRFNCGGIPSLKETIVKYVAKIGIETTTDNILITGGIGESLTCIANGFLGPEATLIYETPSFMNTILLFHSTGVNMQGIPMDCDGMDIHALRDAIQSTNNCILHIQPVNHNPTGIHTTAKRRDKILEICNEFNVPIIENDMFRDFNFCTTYPKPMKAFDINDKIIHIGSLWSGFMGFKSSWIIAPPFVIDKLKYIRTHLELVSNTVVEMITDELIRSGEYEKYMSDLAKQSLERYNKVEKLMEKYLSDIATWRKGYPAFFIWLKFNDNINVIKLHQGSKKHLFFQGNMFEWKDTHHARLNLLGVEDSELEKWIENISIRAKKIMNR